MRTRKQYDSSKCNLDIPANLQIFEVYYYYSGYWLLLCYTAMRLKKQINTPKSSWRF